MTDSGDPDWLLLAASLPGRDAGTARVRLWRKLKDVGAATLRDGVTVIPASAITRTRLTEIVRSIEKQGGTAWVFALPGQAPSLEKKLKALFDRREAYDLVANTAGALRKELAKLDEATARSRFRVIEAEFLSVAELDFFPGAPQTRSREALDRLRSALDRRFSPEEPAMPAGSVRLRDVREFRGAKWATRKRLWVDRVASAWLIRRFIDPSATFHWLDKPVDCPKDAHGFDFDGAEFTHVEGLVTFEVLVLAFNLGEDPGLGGLARLVHYLDVGGALVPEAAGFEAVLAGLRDRCTDDDALLAATSPVLDALYQHFVSSETTRPRTKERS
jgi:hypothetical protein